MEERQPRTLYFVTGWRTKKTDLKKFQDTFLPVNRLNNSWTMMQMTEKFWTIQSDKQTNTAWQRSTMIPFSQCPCPLCPPHLSLSCLLSVWPRAEGLLSALSLGHQAAIVATATNLRVLGQGGRRRGRGGRKEGGSVRWGCRAPWALALVLVRPAVAPFNVMPAGRGLLLQVEDAVDGALQVFIQRVVWRAAAGKAGVIHVGWVRLAAFGRKQRVSCEGGLGRGWPRGMLVHSESPTCSMSIFSTCPLVFTYICLLVCVLLPSVLSPLSLKELWVKMVLGGFDTTAEHLVHFIQPMHCTP